VTVWFIDASVLLAREDADDDQHGAARELLAGDVAGPRAPDHSW